MPLISNEEVSKMVAGQTVPTRFLDTVRRIPGQVALRWREGDGWGELTFADYAERAAHVAAGLGALGVERGTRVVLMMRNRPEFHIADMAVLLCGGTPISIYNSSAPEQVQYLAHHCEAQVAIVEDLDFLDRILKVRGELPALREIVVIDDPEARAPEGVHRWESLLASDPVDLDVAAQIVQPSDLATVIYTSGTTGPPKGVMLDHENVCWTVESLRLSLDEFSTEGRRVVSYLPMAHIAERMTSHYQGAALGYEVTTCPEAGKVATYLPSVRPEVMFAVPRDLGEDLRRHPSDRGRRSREPEEARRGARGGTPGRGARRPRRGVAVEAASRLRQSRCASALTVARRARPRSIGRGGHRGRADPD